MTKVRSYPSYDLAASGVEVTNFERAVMAEWPDATFERSKGLEENDIVVADTGLVDENDGRILIVATYDEGTGLIYYGLAANNDLTYFRADYTEPFALAKSIAAKALEAKREPTPTLEEMEAANRALSTPTRDRLEAFRKENAVVFEAVCYGALAISRRRLGPTNDWVLSFERDLASGNLSGADLRIFATETGITNDRLMILIAEKSLMYASSI